MDFDPDFEFDAPRWFDFAKDEGEFSFSDSWFENEHPLHEPKVPRQKSASGKPLLKKHESKSEPSRKVHTKPCQTNKVKGKKSLSIKTIRTKRGEHGPKTCKEQKEKFHGVREIPSIRIDSREQSPGGEGHTEDERATAGKFRCDPNSAFSPPWSTSPSITENNSGNNSESVCQSLEDNINKQEVTSQVKDNSTQHVQSEPPFIRPAVSPSSMGPSSMGPSPMRSLLAKAVSRATQKRPPGSMKRRLLPTIPPQKKKPEINMSHGTAARTIKVRKARPTSDVRKPNQSSAIPLSPSEASAVPYEDTCTYNSTNTKPRVSGQSEDLDTPLSGLQQSGHSLPYPNKLSTLEHGPGGISESSSFRDVAPGTKQPSPGQGEMSIEEMLKMHNQKILATKCKYDENGRKIRFATPTFCPAPDKSTKTTKRAKQRGSTVSTQPSSNASSIAAAPSKKLAQCSEGVHLPSTSKQEKKDGIPISAPTPDLLIQLSGSASTAVAEDNRAACPGSGGSTKIQKKQGSVAELSCPDTSSKHVITGQKRAGSSTERARALAKQKRRSCMPSIGVNANTGVLRPSSGTHQNQKGAGKCPSKQKRRSCVAGIQKSSFSDAEEELEQLIQRHNSQIVAKKS